MAGQDIGLYHVSHIDKVTGLLAITINHRLLALEQGGDEPGSNLPLP